MPVGHSVLQRFCPGPHPWSLSADGHADERGGAVAHGCSHRELGREYGTSPDALSSAVADEVATTEHEVRLTGLGADTKYYYSVGYPGVMLGAGPDYFFGTAPNGPKPTRIWVLGDSGRRTFRPQRC